MHSQTRAIAEIVAERDRLAAENAKLRDLLQQMLDVVEHADETGYVADCGFVDLDKLHEEVRAMLTPAASRNMTAEKTTNPPTQ